MLNGVVWGEGGKLTSAEDRAARRRALAQQLSRGADTSPVAHWTQGAARVLNSLADVTEERRLSKEQEEADKSGMAALTGLMGGGGFPAMAAVGGAPVATGSATGSGATKVVNAPEQFAPLFAEKEAKFGLPSGYLARTAQIESNFNPNAKNPNSSATGLFQFINSTARQYGLDNPRDPVAATAAAARLASDNKAHLQRVLGREPTAGELYLAHQQGAGGAAKLLSNPNASASSVVGDAAARLNRGAGMTASAFANQWINKFGMPVVKPGDGAAPMPLARQQAQTAPMPTVGLADMPAPGANQSALEARPVAPVSGDNPQQLLADADYYEKNGNPEAARQMRERAAMAGQGAPAMAQGAPPMAPGGGVAIANNEDDVRFLEARMAAEQGNPQAPMPAQDPSQMQTVAITPNAQNAGDVFSNVPMGLGANQFVQRAPFAPSPDQAAPMAQEAGINPAASVAPSRDTVPLPPEPVMQQPAPMMQPQRPMAMGFNPAMGGENGISPQMFADAEFAAREGRPAPGMMPQGQAQAAPAMSPVQSVAAAMPQGGAQMAAQAPEQPSAVQRVAGAMPPGDRLAQLATIAANPSISPQIRTVAATMWQKESERMNRDPRDSTLKDLQIRKAERDLKDRPNTEIIRDPNTGEVLAIDKNNPGAGAQVIRPGGPSSQAPTTRTIKQPDGSEVAVQWNPQSKAWEPMAAPQGGNAVRAPAKLTEQQSKDLVYYNRGTQALADFGDGSALTGGQGLVGNTVGQIPVVGNFAKSEDFQRAEQAGRNFLNSILRKDTGAAITNQEMSIYGGVFLPQPGDSPSVIKQKNEARRQAIDAIRDGLGPADVLALGQRLTRREDARTPTPDRPGNAAPQPSPAPAQGGFRVLKVE